MRKILFGVIITLIVLFTFKYCSDKKQDEIVLKENSALIQEQLKNVGKLVVTEGHYSQVFDYKNSKALFNSLVTSEKTALVVANAEVTVTFDLSQLEYEVDDVNKVLRLKSIPEPEIKVYPELEYYDIDDGLFNQFESEDYNKINAIVKRSFQNKIENSQLKTNAKNRLISELAKFYILTNSLGWRLEYNENPIDNISNFETIDFKF